MSITVKTTHETYRVYPTGKKIVYATMESGSYVPAHDAESVDYSEMMDAVKHAFRIAGEIGCDVMVDRVTHHEPIAPEMAAENIFLATEIGRTETKTGELYIQMPRFTDASISRYHPNNGWVIPETIEIT